MVTKKGTIELQISEIRYSGVFDLEKLYQAMHSWFRDHYYEVSEDYKHKMTSEGAKVEISITAEREESDFLKYAVEVETEMWGMSEVEVVKEGKKQKLNKARMRIIIKIKATLDYNSEFDRSEFLIRLFNILRFTILKDKIMVQWMGKFIAEAYKLQTKIKEVLEMHTAYHAW